MGNRLVTKKNNLGNFITTCNTFLSGSIDYLVNNEIWEFKNSLSLLDEHKIQCAAYIATYFLQHGIMNTGKLFNTRTLELLEIILDNPEEFINILMLNR